MAEGDFEQAVTLLESGEDQLYRDIVLARLGFSYAKTSRIEKARGALETLEQRYEDDYTSAYLIATVHSALGETDAAFEWLNLAFENRDPFMIRLKTTYLFDNIRDDPRYGDLMARVGFE